MSSPAAQPAADPNPTPDPAPDLAPPEGSPTTDGAFDPPRLFAAEGTAESTPPTTDGAADGGAPDGSSSGTSGSSSGRGSLSASEAADEAAAPTPDPALDAALDAALEPDAADAPTPLAADPPTAPLVALRQSLAAIVDSGAMVDPAVAWSLRVSVPTGAPPPASRGTAAPSRVRALRTRDAPRDRSACRAANPG